MTKIKWKQPPPDNRGRRGKSGAEYAALADALRARPGEWAVYGERMAATSAARIKRGDYAHFQPAGAFEAVTRKRPDGKFDIYVRYVGAEVRS